MPRIPPPRYHVVWDRFRGKYVASSPERPLTTVVHSDAHQALRELQQLIRLLR